MIAYKAFLEPMVSASTLDCLAWAVGCVVSLSPFGFLLSSSCSLVAPQVCRPGVPGVRLDWYEVIALK